MKHLIFVSVAVGIFSGTSISAQKRTGSLRARDAVADNKQVKFIEGIEIRPETTVAAQSPVVTRSQVIKTDFPVGNEGSAIEQCTSLQFKYAQLLNIEVEAVTNVELYRFIEQWWATPYRYGGATKDGIDCSAYSGTLIHNIYGITLSRTARSQYEECYKLDKEDLQQGDLVFFKTRRGVSHVGVYLGNGYFTHASTSNGVMISSLNEDYYNKRYLGGGRVPARASE